MKPENVLIGDDGRVKVADFGLVRSVDTVTNSTGTVLGTVSYLAPEQIEHGTADPRVDVYACGILLYEMLTGEKPHDGDSPAIVLYKHLHDDVPPPSSVVPGLAPALDSLVAAATARDAGARPADAVALFALTREGRGRLHRRAARRAAPAGAVRGARQRRRPHQRHPALAHRAASPPRERGRRRGPGAPHQPLPVPSPAAAPAAHGRAPRPRRDRRGGTAGARPGRGHLVHQLRPVHQGPAGAVEDGAAGPGPPRRGGARGRRGQGGVQRHRRAGQGDRHRPGGRMPASAAAPRCP